MLACSIYIDLNEIRAQLAATPEESCHTSAYCRILAHIKRREREAAAGGADASATYEPDDPDYGLCPLSEQDCAPLLGPPGVASVAASQACEPDGQNLGSVHKNWRHGFLPLSVDEYLELLDWNARQGVPGKLGATDARVPPILSRLGLEPEYWVNLVENFDRRFRSAAGGVARLREEAARTGRRWLQGVGAVEAYG